MSLKSIGFQSTEVELEQLRARLRQMTDEELIKFGKMVRALSAPSVGVAPDPWKAQLEEARAEWRRRYPGAISYKRHPWLGRTHFPGPALSGM